MHITPVLTLHIVVLISNLFPSLFSPELLAAPHDFRSPLAIDTSTPVLETNQGGLPSDTDRLIEKLRVRVDKYGAFNERLYSDLVMALKQLNFSEKNESELWSNTRDFADGKLRPSLFVAYLKEELPKRITKEDSSVKPEHESPTNLAMNESQTRSPHPSGSDPKAALSENPFDRFRQSLKTSEEPSAQPSQEGISKGSSTSPGTTEDPFNKFREAGPRTRAAGDHGSSGVRESPDSINLYCTGNLNRYTGQQLNATQGFEFRTIINPQQKKHTVQNVIKGSLFKSGSTYEVLGGQRDVFVLTADSTDPHYGFTSVQYDRIAGKISGQGSVNMSQERGRLLEQIGKMGINIPSDSLAKNGLDSMRRVEIDGICQPY